MRPSGIQLVLPFALFLLAALPACENNRTKLTKEQSEGGLGMPDSSSNGKRISIDPRCDLNERVDDPKDGTIEFVISELLAAAADPGDENVAFQKFFKHFPADAEQKWVHDQYWSRARKWVNKYLQQDAAAGIVYKICERRDMGDGSIKVFVQSLDPQKSNPPMTFKKDDAGAWKVIFYTP